MSSRKEFKDLHTDLLGAGWTYEGMTSDCHHKFKAPPGHQGRPFIILGSSPGRGRAYQNARAFIRRAGVTPSKGT